MGRAVRELLALFTENVRLRRSERRDPRVLLGDTLIDALASLDTVAA